MRGICVHQFGGPESLVYTDLPDPEPTSTQVLVKVAAASVNYADLKARAGEYHLGRQPPFIPGIDLAGTVTAVGSEVRNFRTGDRVVAFSASGSYAELATAEENLTFCLAPEIDLQTGGAFPLATGAAMHMLTVVAQIAPGERILIHGASGGVGSVAIQLSRMLGASAVVATTGNNWKAQAMRDLGATHVVNSSSDYYEERLRAVVAEGRFDIILNPVGGRLLEKDLACLADFGRLVVFGTMAETAERISPEALYGRNQQLLGFSFGHCRKLRPETIAPTMKKVQDAVLAGSLKILVDTELPLAEAAAAHRLLEERKVIGKVVLVP